MAEISAAMVKELREQTGAGIMDCKRALQETGGNLAKASDILKEQGLAKAAKKSERVAGQGTIEAYIHAGGRIGVLVEVNCETDFVARTDDFKRLVHDIAMQVAAMDPAVVGNEPQAPTPDGGAEIPVEKILLKQVFIKDGSVTIEHLVKDAIAKVGENIVIRRFTRFELGV